MSPDELQKLALQVIGKLWPAVELQTLRSGDHDWGVVFARWTFVHLLHREAGLSRRLTSEAVNWRTVSTLVSAMKALDCDVATNRTRARQLGEAVKLFRQLLQEKGSR